MSVHALSTARTSTTTLVLLCAMGALAAQAGVPPVIGTCEVYPSDHAWNTPVTDLPVHANSAAMVAAIGGSAGVHADFGSGTWNGGPIGIPFVTVPGTQPRVPVTFDYADESDPGPYPIPPNPPIEGGANASGDRHVLVLDRDACVLYELFDAHPDGAGWRASAGAVFDLRSYALRPAGWTSADAAGLPILPGLVRYEEVAAGAIRHAIRFTAPGTRRAYVWPARHYASSLTATQYPPMGQRFRLKAAFDASAFSRDARVILDAMKTYGIILADNGSAWYISGVPDERWNNDVLHELGRVTGSNFEAVDASSLIKTPDSGQAATGTAPTARLQVTVQGRGRVSSAPGGIDCPGGCSANYTAGTTARLTAAAASGAAFGGWSGGCAGTLATCDLALPADRAVAATFTDVAGTLRVVTPNGGERWAAGRKVVVSWTSTGVTADVAIGLSLDGGTTWTTLVASTPNDGTEAVTLPLSATTRARVRLTSLSTPAVSDTSDAHFVIAPRRTRNAPDATGGRNSRPSRN